MATETEKGPETSANGLIADWMEALKLVQSRGATDPMKVHFEQFEEEMAGMTFKTNHNRYVLGAWIVDTGATRHMCGDVALLHSLNPIDPNPVIHLLNDSVTKATHVGTAQLTDIIVLAEVLHIPSFQYNLLSISQLCKALPIRFIFHNSSCILEDRKTEEVLAIGNQIGKLFYLTPSSFSSTAINKCAKPSL
ncbi:UNVERIFIED_CONTAM: hypothetical protein Slati_1376400 [Sesamum latifolium]|uniref:Retrovirus-related Pol polyprotein from transposon TNT 1-94-like beta-barrel domain-containing protein n=1 Tax=Sesamum latifolium TaxID=2727402 RepID=A0AAW2XK89_9LAMI